MHTPRLRVALGIVLALLLAAGCSADEPEPAATTAATATTPPTTPPPTIPPPAEPFALELGEVHVLTTDNAAILSTEPRPVDEEAARQAVDAAAKVLTAYLDAAFVDPSTRFTEAAFQLLLKKEARAVLTDDDRAGLGELSLEVDHTITGTASADPMVTMDGGTARDVTFTYEATLTVVEPDGDEVPLRQHGTVVLVPIGEHWRALAVDLALEGAEASS